MSFSRVFLLAALTVSVASASATTPPPRDLNFTIRNHSSFAIAGLFKSGCDVIDWQPLTLSTRAFPDGILYPGQNVVYPFAPGCVNLLLLSGEGEEFSYGIQITSYDVYEWVLTDDQVVVSDGVDVYDEYNDGYNDYVAGAGYVEVSNTNGYEDIKDVFFRTCGTGWDSDYLVEGEQIAVDESYTFELPGGCWDAAVRMTDGQVHNWTNLNLQPDRTLRIVAQPSH